MNIILFRREIPQHMDLAPRRSQCPLRAPFQEAMGTDPESSRWRVRGGPKRVDNVQEAWL